MKINKFNVTFLPELTEDFVSSVQTEVDKLKQNYKFLRRDICQILKIALENDITKPTIYYNLFFLIELSLKYYLLINSDLQINEVERLNHNTEELIEKCRQYENFDEFLFLLNKLKRYNDKKIDYSRYQHFKDNKEKGKSSLIFKLTMKAKERQTVKEVIEWLELHI